MRAGRACCPGCGAGQRHQQARRGSESARPASPRGGSGRRPQPHAPAAIRPDPQRLVAGSDGETAVSVIHLAARLMNDEAHADERSDQQRAAGGGSGDQADAMNPTGRQRAPMVSRAPTATARAIGSQPAAGGVGEQGRMRCAPAGGFAAGAPGANQNVLPSTAGGCVKPGATPRRSRGGQRQPYPPAAQRPGGHAHGQQHAAPACDDERVQLRAHRRRPHAGQRHHHQKKKKRGSWRPTTIR